MTSDEQILRAEKAQRLLQDPLMAEALERLEKDVSDAWARSSIRDKEGQHELLLMMQTARKFKAIFTEYIQTGELLKHQLKTPKLRQVLTRFGVADPY
jgi:hypothetical protein